MANNWQKYKKKYISREQPNLDFYDFYLEHETQI